MAKKIKLTIVSQERELISAQVDQVTVPAAEGTMTILPNHTPIVSRLNYGELRYVQAKGAQSLVVSKGFVHVTPNNEVIVVVDAAKHVREISLNKSKQAMLKAKETLKQSSNQRELMMAEASLRQAMWEIRLAQKTKKTQH